MATSWTFTAFYSGATDHIIRFEIRAAGTSGNSSRYSWELFQERTSAWNNKRSTTSGPWTVKVGNNNYSGSQAALFTSTVASILIKSGTSGYITHDSNGNLNFEVSAEHRDVGNFGRATITSKWLTADRIGIVPGAVPWVGNFRNVTPVSFTFSWGAPSRGTSDITNYGWRILKDGVQIYQVTGGVFYTDDTADNITLQPNTTYGVQVHAKNEFGWGPWSPIGYVTTLPPIVAGIDSITPNADGTCVTVVVTPPSGFGIPSSFNIYGRLGGPGLEPGIVGSPWVLLSGGPAQQTICGLIPGYIYDFRATTIIGSSESDPTPVTSITMPVYNPAFGPLSDAPNGDASLRTPIPGMKNFWNGDTADNAFFNFAWVGAANQSVSTAQTLLGSAVGWLDTAEAWANTGGGSGNAYLAGGGLIATSGLRSMCYTCTIGGATTGFRGGLDVTENGYAEVAWGGTYVGSIHVRANRDIVLIPTLLWYDASNVLQGSTSGTPTLTPAGQVLRLAVTGTPPIDTATRAAIIVTDAVSPLISGDMIEMDAAMIAAGNYEWFDGNSPDTTRFEYSWVGAEHSSPSLRGETDADDENPLLDPDCDPIPEPPRPPVVVDDCILENGTWRRYWIRISVAQVGQFLEVVPTLYLATGVYPERQVRIRYYANPSNLDPLTFTGDYFAEQIVSYIPPCTTMTIDGVGERAYAVVGKRTGAGTTADPYLCSPGDGATLDADHLLYGTDGGPATWPVLACNTDYLISLDVPLDSHFGNLDIEVALTART